MRHSGYSTDRGVSEYKKTFPIYQKLVDENPGHPKYLFKLAEFHMNYFFTLRNAGLENDLVREINSALNAYKLLVHDYSAVTEFQDGFAGVLCEIGWNAAQAGKLKSALDYYSQEEEVRTMYPDPGAVTPPIDSLANCLTNQVDVLRRMGDLPRAKEKCERSIALRLPLYESDRRSQTVCGRLAETYFRLGQVKSDMGDQSGAVRAWRRVIELYSELSSPSGEFTFFRTCCHAQLYSLGGKPGSGLTAEERQAQLQLAITWLSKSVEFYKVPDAYRTESALDPIRHLPQFQLLMDELAKTIKAAK